MKNKEFRKGYEKAVEDFLEILEFNKFQILFQQEKEFREDEFRKLGKFKGKEFEKKSKELMKSIMKFIKTRLE